MAHDTDWFALAKKICDPRATEAAADRADSAVGMAEKVRQHLTASVVLCRLIAHEGSALYDHATEIAEDLRVLLVDEVIPLLHAAEEAANEAKIEDEDGHANAPRYP